MFKRWQSRPAAPTVDLGRSVVALRLDDGAGAPAGTLTVICDPAGQARRTTSARLARGAGMTVFCFHPGPYQLDLIPFQAAPELGLRLQFVIDADPRVEQQRFDLFLASEVAASLTLAALGAALQEALRAELAHGHLALPPCTAPDEWHAFRAGLNQLLYTRFGLTVDDCLPVDLGASVDFAALLAARIVHTDSPSLAAAEVAAPAAQPVPIARGAWLAPASAASSDALALRRLFLELPALTSGWRLLALPPGQPIFQLHQRLLQRLHLCLAQAASMPALAWAAPEQPLEAAQQARRAGASAAAVQALDAGWALLARWRLAAPADWPALQDDADRLLANLELALTSRRATQPAPGGAPDLAPISPPTGSPMLSPILSPTLSPISSPAVLPARREPQ